MFDPFWARVQEAGVVVTAHAGFEDGYIDVAEAVARTWGIGGEPKRAAGPTRRRSSPPHWWRSS